VSPRPTIFISAVSKELGRARQLVANTLTFLGYQPVWQDIFGTETGDLRSVLREKIDQCKGVVQLVGQCYGVEPPTPDEQFGRVSYTQYEALYARERAKKVWYLFIDENFPADRCDAEPKELSELQAAYRRRLQSDTHVFHPLTSGEALEASVLKLRDDLSRLRRGVKQWAVGVVMLLVFLSAATIWLIHVQRRQTTVIQKESEQVTAIVDRYQKMQQALVRLAEVEAQAKEPGAKLSSEEQRARAYSLLENELGLPTGVLEKELPAFALELYNRSDSTPLMRARAAYALGKFDEAEKLSSESATQDRQGYKTVQRMEEEFRKHAVEGYVLAGQSAQKRIQYARAMEYFREAEKLTDRNHYPEEWAEVQHAIAYLLLDQGQYRDAENILRTVVEVCTQMIGSENPDTLMSRNDLGHALWEEGKYAEAEAQYRDVIRLDEKVLGPEDPHTLWSRNGLAITLNLQGKYAEAEAQYRDVIKLREKVLGPEHRLTLVSLMNLAFVLNAEGKYAEAEAQYYDVIKKEEKVLGPEHPDTLLSRHNLTIVLDAEGKYVEVEAQYRELIKTQGKVLGPEHPQTLMSLGNLGVALWNQGKYAEAEAQFRDVIKRYEKVLGPEHPNTLSFRSNLADALGNQGKYAEAEAEYRDVIKLCEKVLGPEHPDTLDSRRALAWTLGHREGKYADAEAESRSVIKLLEKHIAADNPLTLSSRNVFADALEGQGKYVNAEAEYRSVMKLQEKVLGPKHPNTLASRSGLAKTLMAEGKDAAAEMRQVIHLREKAIGPEHPDTLESCYDFAFGLEHQDKIQEAEEFAKRAAQGARKVLGPDHPFTKKYEALLHDLETALTKK
jgi:tetratricopeptide (TPR) repeat protein